MAVKLESFVFMGSKYAIFRSRETHETECYLKHLVEITLSDETAESDLKGGWGYKTLAKFYGDRTTTLSGTTATMTADLLKILSSNTLEEKSAKAVQVVEDLKGTSGSFTLGQTPSTTNATIVVYAISEQGISTKLKKTDSSPSDATEFKADGTAITTDSSVTAIRAFYFVDKDTVTIEGKDFVAKNYEFEALLVAKNIEDGKIYYASLQAPNVTVNPTFSLTSVNSADAPDNVELNISLLSDERAGYAYSIDFFEAE